MFFKYLKRKKTFTLKSIAAIDLNNAIGYQGDLLYKIPADMKYFVEQTGSDPVIMRRGTFESFGAQALPRRLNIVISRKSGYIGKGAIVVSNLEQALCLAKKESRRAWIIGGAGLYEESLPLVSELYITQIFNSKKANTFFPKFKHLFTLSSKSEKFFDEKNQVSFQFQIWKKKTSLL